MSSENNLTCSEQINKNVLNKKIILSLLFRSEVSFTRICTKQKETLFL